MYATYLKRINRDGVPAGPTRWGSVIYFIVYYLCTNYMIMALLIAAILDSLDDAAYNQDTTETEAIPGLTAAKEPPGVTRSPVQAIHPGSSEQGAFQSGMASDRYLPASDPDPATPTPREPAPEVPEVTDSLSGAPSAGGGTGKLSEEEEVPAPPPGEDELALGLFGPEHPLRRGCQWAAQSWAYLPLLKYITIVQILYLVLDSGRCGERYKNAAKAGLWYDMQYALNKADITVQVLSLLIFTADFLCKIVAGGFYKTKSTGPVGALQGRISPEGGEAVGREESASREDGEGDERERVSEKASKVGGGGAVRHHAHANHLQDEWEESAGYGYWVSYAMETVGYGGKKPRQGIGGEEDSVDYRPRKLPGTEASSTAVLF